MRNLHRQRIDKNTAPALLLQETVSRVLPCESSGEADNVRPVWAVALHPLQLIPHTNLLIDRDNCKPALEHSAQQARALYILRLRRFAVNALDFARLHK